MVFDKLKKLMPLGLIIIISLACSLPNQLSFDFLGAPSATRSPTPTSTSTIPPTNTPTPTPQPTPTPSPAFRIQHGQQAVFNGDWDQAIIEFNLVLSSESEADVRSTALFELGRTYFHAGEHQLALESLETLLSEYPDSALLADTYFSLGQVYTALGLHNQAAVSFQNYLQARPGVIDATIHEMAGDALLAAGDYSGAISEYQKSLAAPRLDDNLSLEIKIGQTYTASGDFSTAIVVYRDVYNRTSSDFTRAQMNLLMGQAYTALGEMDQAYNVYQDSVNKYPHAYDSFQALLALVQAGIPVDQFQRGLINYNIRQYGVALLAFDRYLQSDPEDRAIGYYHRGLTYRFLGQPQDALEDFERVIVNYPEHSSWADAWEQIATVQWLNLQQPLTAIQTYANFVEANPEHPRSSDFLFQAGNIAERSDNLERAALLWEKLARDYPSSTNAFRALFLAGITRCRLEDYTSALNNFQRLVNISATLKERSQAHFWVAKAHQAVGDHEAYILSLQQAAAADPTGYYSERAADLLAGRAPFTPPVDYDLSFDENAERAEAEAWTRTVFNIPAEVDLSTPGPLVEDARFIRGNELWRLGLYQEARLEFEDLRLGMQHNPANTYRLVNHLKDLGLYRSAIFAARQVLTLAGMNNAQTLSAPVYFNRIRFGVYYRELVIPAAQEYEIHPLLLYSLMRQESLFEGFVTSHAGARGLMQIIPSTGQEQANRVGWPQDYTSEDLYRPVVSVKLGADYLKRQLNFLGGDIYAALAAYNGGPGNSAAWKTLAPDDPDLFLEVIRFEETRNYIRAIYEVFNIYRRIYDRSP
ncbi:MAG: tetratricopeptide repeat protein [Anaerolineales bacterium]|nr:tetratricopeptide repeat protein [Anaerolineales bacterium]